MVNNKITHLRHLPYFSCISFYALQHRPFPTLKLKRTFFLFYAKDDKTKRKIISNKKLKDKLIKVN